MSDQEEDGDGSNVHQGEHGHDRQDIREGLGQLQNALGLASLYGGSAVKLKKFSGDDGKDVVEWLDSYDALADNWDDDTKVKKLRAFLAGTAEKWYAVHVKKKKIEFKVVAKMMVEQFLPSNYAAYCREQLYNRKQKAHETVSNYIIDIENLCMKVNPDMEEDEKVAFVLNGMDPEIVKSVYLFDHDTIAAIQAAARAVERGREVESKRTAKHVSIRDVQVDSEMDELVKSMQDIKLGLRRLEQNNRPSNRNPWNNGRFFEHSDYRTPRDNGKGWVRNGGQEGRVFNQWSVGPTGPGPAWQEQDGPASQWQPPPNRRPSGPRFPGTNWQAKPFVPRSSGWQGQPSGQADNNWQGNRPPAPWNNGANEQRAIQGTGQPQSGGRTNTGKIRCYQCGEGHFVRNCPQIVRDATTHGLQNNACVYDGRNTSDLIMTKVKVEEIETEAMVDTGSSVTAISEKFAYQLHLTPEPWTGHKFSAVNGSSVEPIGGLTVWIEISDGARSKRVKLNVLVIEGFPHDVLLGNDFNVAAGVVVDCVKRSIRLDHKSEKVRMDSPHPVRRGVEALRNQKPLTLAPRSRGIATVATDCIPHRRCSPVVHLNSINPCLMVSEGPVHLDHGKTQIEITNLKISEQHLDVGDLVASYKVVDIATDLPFSNEKRTINALTWKAATAGTLDDTTTNDLVEKITSETDDKTIQRAYAADLIDDRNLDLPTAIQETFGHPIRMAWLNNPLYEAPPKNWSSVLSSDNRREFTWRLKRKINRRIRMSQQVIPVLMLLGLLMCIWTHPLEAVFQKSLHYVLASAYPTVLPGPKVFTFPPGTANAVNELEPNGSSYKPNVPRQGNVPLIERQVLMDLHRQYERTLETIDASRAPVDLIKPMMYDDVVLDHYGLNGSTSPQVSANPIGSNFWGDVWRVIVLYLCYLMLILSVLILSYLAFECFRRWKLRRLDQGTPNMYFDNTSQRLSRMEFIANLNKLVEPGSHSTVPLDEGFVKVGDNNSSEMKGKLLDLLRKYNSQFAFSDDELGYTNLFDHVIETGDHPPIALRPYRYSQLEQKEMERQVQIMLHTGVISPSQSPWASPPLLVKKKDGSLRLCIDYRKLNAVTVKDVHPLPNIQDVLDSLQDSRVFTTLDLKSGYWQCSIRKADRAKTAFYLPNGGLHEFNVTSFGLCNAPATFARLMRIVLAGLPWTQVICYLDDILIHSANEESHLLVLETVLLRLKTAGLTLNPAKCFFVLDMLNYLRHTISANGVQPNDDNLKSLREFPVPKNVKDVQSFVGLASYYRRFVRSFSDIIAPLTELTRKAIPFTWNKQRQEAFEKIKERLLSKPVLKHYDSSLKTEIHADASGYGLGALLLQHHPDGPHVVAYASRKLSTAELNYSTTEKETLAVVFAVNKFRPYVWRREFVIVTDHHALCFLMKKDRLAQRLARWAIQLQEYNFTIVYKSGKKHLDADCLSRYPVDPPRDEEDHVTMNALLDLVKPSDDLRIKQLEDTKLRILMDILDHYESSSSKEKKQVANFTLINGILYKRKQTVHGPKLVIVVPNCLRTDILYAYHDDPTAGHLGYHKTLDRMRTRFYFPKMGYYVRKYVASCKDCQTKKMPAMSPAGLLQPIAVGGPFEKFGIDILGPFPTSTKGNRHIIVACEYNTRFAVAKAIPDANAVTVADFFLKEIVLKFGPPKQLLSDRGVQFTSRIMQEVLELLRVKCLLITAYHAQANGLTEHMNRTLAVTLSMYVDEKHKDWDDYVDYAVFAYNSSVHASSKFSPFSLIYGQEPLTPLEVMYEVPSLGVESPTAYANVLRDHLIELRTMARLNITASQIGSKKYYDKRHRDITFKVNDLVLVFFPTRTVGLAAKLMHRFHGPYRITEVKSPLVYQVELVHKRKGKRKSSDSVHISRLSPGQSAWI